MQNVILLWFIIITNKSYILQKNKIKY